VQKKRIEDNALCFGSTFARTASIALAANQFTQRYPLRRFGIGRQVATISL
jgi:hypothetical protein